MKRVSMILLAGIATMMLAGCAHLGNFFDTVANDPNVPQVVNGLAGLFDGIPILSTILGFVGWGVTFIKKAKQDTKVEAITAGVQKAINSIKDKQVVEAIKELLRQEANVRGVAQDINTELAYLRAKGLIPADKSGT